MNEQTNQSNPFRWGILGTGWMADHFARELALHPEAVVTAVASKGLARAEKFAAEHHIPRAYDLYEGVIASADVDIVYDATTNNHHLDNGIACLSHRKPLLLEKPLCQNTDELNRLMEVYRKQGTFLMEAMWMRFFPIIRDLKNTLSTIEPLVSLEATFGNAVPFDENHRIYSPALGGSALLDLGVYPLNLAHLLFGLDTCTVTSDIKWAKTGVDETARITLHYPGGLTAHLFCSAAETTPHRATFTGERGTVILEDFFHPSKLEVTVRGERTRLLQPTYPHMGYNFEIDEVHRALRAGELESPGMPLATSREILSFIDGLLDTPIA